MTAQITVIRIGGGVLTETPGGLLTNNLTEPGQYLWLDIANTPGEEGLNRLEQLLGLHELALDNLFDTDRNPRLLEFEDHILLGARFIKEGPDGLEPSTIGIVLGKNFLITAHENRPEIISTILARVRANGNQVLNTGPDRLLYLVLDTLVDHYYEILDTLSEGIDAIDDRASELTQKQDLVLQHDILATKRQLLTIHRAATPLRDALLNLRRTNRTLISEANELYLRDVFEHILQLLDTVETYREILSSTTELIMTAASNRMNEIMTFLTVFTTFFIPVNFIAGFYGMNLVMPEAKLAMTYPVVIAIMAALIAFMFVWFKRKRWL
ncbi:MAG: magnesium/cobalt transporter CorA [Clostridia bacterium]|nr:magnesium/cobalt transporter CorA [Clostridia bacterium]NCC75205.1 magnesium/cobalt transporter CorA [Clostridia bacterium]